MNFDQIVGDSPALRQVLELVQTVAPSDSTVLLLGETGTGKELIARAIHDHSRRERPHLREAQLCGNPYRVCSRANCLDMKKERSPAPSARRSARLELADQGTLFLDEVGDVPPEIQPKLLRALQEREFERLGSTRTKKVDVRLVAATNRDLGKMIADSRISQRSLLSLERLSHSHSSHVSGGDIPVLARYFAQNFAQQMEKQIETIPAATMKALTSKTTNEVHNNKLVHY